MSNQHTMLIDEKLANIAHHKKAEQTLTDTIRKLEPNLEMPFITHLQNWESVLSQTEQAAKALIKEVRSSYSEMRRAEHIETFVRSANTQSKEFIRQLHLLMAQSSALTNNKHAVTTIHALIREAEPAPHLNRSDNHHQRASQPDRQQPVTGEGNWSNPFPIESTSPVAIGGHTLPPLPYPYNALEPYIDEQTMRLHHDKHHQSYVDGLNKAEKKMAEARSKHDYELLKHWEREAAFHGAGHYLHTLFWNVMSPTGGGKPNGALAAQIKRDFGSFEAFREHFSKAAEAVEGGGWAILVWSPRSHRLQILQAEKHQNLSQWDVIPLLPLDVWEHAYYLKYNNKRADYIDAWWNVVNWPHAAERFEQASRLKWMPY